MNQPPIEKPSIWKRQYGGGCGFGCASIFLGLIGVGYLISIQPERPTQNRPKLTAPTPTPDPVIGAKPPSSTWDGAVFAVKRYLQANAHDPDIQWVSWGQLTTVELDEERYWAVEVSFRAKNGFGAYRLEKGIALIRHNQVVKFVPKP